MRNLQESQGSPHIGRAPSRGCVAALAQSASVPAAGVPISFLGIIFLFLFIKTQEGIKHIIFIKVLRGVYLQGLRSFSGSYGPKMTQALLQRGGGGCPASELQMVPMKWLKAQEPALKISMLQPPKPCHTTLNPRKSLITTGPRKPFRLT